MLAVLVKIGVYYIIANTIAYIIAVLINYTFNQKFVFKNSAKSNTKEGKIQFTNYCIVRLISLVIDNLLFYILVSVIGLPLYVSRIFLTFSIILITFIFNKLFIFNFKEGQ